MKKLVQLSFVIIILSLVLSCLYNRKNHPLKEESFTNSSFFYQQIKTDTLFDSPQIISIISLPKNNAQKIQFDLVHHPTNLIKTSQFAEKKNAQAAINGGFFNMDKGGSVTYLEKNDSVYHRNIPDGTKWAIADWAKTGAIIIQKNGQLKIELANTEQFYEQSKKEASVLITGPMLINNGQKVKLKEVEFVNKRHPRTCICETNKSNLLLTIDGRQSQAAGMSLLELQTFLINQNCIAAINLDGGGSTTMWIKDKGVINQPSDFWGERKIANALLIK